MLWLASARRALTLTRFKLALGDVHDRVEALSSRSSCQPLQRWHQQDGSLQRICHLPGVRLLQQVLGCSHPWSMLDSSMPDTTSRNQVGLRVSVVDFSEPDGVMTSPRLAMANLVV